MKKLWDKKIYFLIALSVILFLTVSIFSFVSIKQLQGNARVVNYDGIVRGATQKLMKMELQSAHSGGVDLDARNALRNRLDRILHALDTGEGEDSATETLSTIIALPDDTHSGMIKSLLEKWDALKKEIDNVRLDAEDGAADTTTLYAMSEEYFTLANATVFAAEDFSEAQVGRTTTILVIVNAVFILAIIIAGIFVVRGMAVRRRADALGKIAYVDPLTQLENRAGCERKISSLKHNPTADSLVVIMFDMNNLKLANDFLGHQGGDQIIAQFARIIGAEAKDFGFIGRYGGDEFLAIFEKSDASKARDYLERVADQITAYNSLRVNDLEKISFAAGVSTGLLSNMEIEDMIYEADRNMYANKREMKKSL
ncbi:MAG: diguanylate cyclase [Oscillospiraceae bacterium]|jgi:diguanylate cyclase (GGDEF)-like protein|nr:diguanylate cyclase [Oscillospiraceae bacterium]